MKIVIFKTYFEIGVFIYESINSVVGKSALLPMAPPATIIPFRLEIPVIFGAQNYELKGGLQFSGKWDFN